MTEPVQWLKNIVRTESSFDFLAHVCSLDGKQLATDGRILVWLDEPADGLPVFPEDNDRAAGVRKWFSVKAKVPVDRKRLLDFCNEKRYAAECPECEGSGVCSCDECDGKGCFDCENSGKQPCWHLDPITNYGFIGETLFNRRLIWKVLSNVSDDTVYYRLGRTDEMIRFEGDGWKAAIMPVREGTCDSAPKFKGIK